MTEFLETLRVQEGELLSPHIHNRRMHYTSPKVQSFDLASIDVPLQYRSGIVKCSVVYSDKILSICPETNTQAQSCRMQHHRLSFEIRRPQRVERSQRIEGRM